MKGKRKSDADTKIYRPVMPEYETYIVTDNAENSRGELVNKSEENAELARKWLDENEK